MWGFICLQSPNHYHQNKKQSSLYKGIIYKCSFNQHTARLQRSLKNSPGGIPFSVKLIRSTNHRVRECIFEDEMMCREKASEQASEQASEREWESERGRETTF